MDTNNLHTGWNATDEGESVPVRVSTTSAKADSPSTPRSGPITSPAPTKKKEDYVIHGLPGTTDPWAMRLSAMSGVAVVLIGAAMYFGVMDLRGSLSGSMTASSDGATVKITAQGTFEPKNISLKPGETLTIKNENKDPQVLKSANERQLFPVQVVFDSPLSITVPTDAKGAYVILSETLPETETLTINVALPAESTQEAVVPRDVQAHNAQSSLMIPLPFASGTPVASTIETEVPAPVQTQKSTVSVESSEHRKDAAVIDLGKSIRPAAPAEMKATELPTNPYTVDALKKNERRQELLARQAQLKEQTHAGAPLKELRKHMPKRTSDTGPAGTLLMLLPAFGAVILLSRKAVSA